MWRYIKVELHTDIKLSYICLCNDSKYIRINLCLSKWIYYYSSFHVLFILLKNSDC